MVFLRNRQYTDIHIYDPSTAPGGRVTRKDVLNHIRQRLDKLLMREKRVPVPLGLDYSYWVEDEDFDIEYHVRHTKLSKPGDWRQLVAEAGRIIETPLDMSRPLWEIHVIEGWTKLVVFQRDALRWSTRSITGSSAEVRPLI